MAIWSISCISWIQSYLSYSCIQLPTRLIPTGYILGPSLVFKTQHISCWVFHIFPPNLFLLLYFQPVWIYQPTQSLKPETWEFCVLLYTLPTSSVSESPSLQVTIILLDYYWKSHLPNCCCSLHSCSNPFHYLPTRVSFLKCQSHCVSPILNICLSLAFYCF